MPKCKACTAEIPAGSATCPFCGTADPIAAAVPSAPEVQAVPPAPEVQATPPAPQPAAAVELHDKGPGGSGFDHDVKTFKCESCGATVSYDPALKTMACAYCGSTYVVEVEGQQVERPGRVVPFAFARDHAEKLFWQWLGKGFFRPRDLTKKSTINEIRGVYMPFWAFDADADSDWSADAGYNYTEQEAYTDKDEKGNTVTKYRNVTKTRWQPARGEHTAHYEDWLISASQGLDQDWVGKIVPFQMEQAKPYSGDYLAGFAAENPSLTAAEGKVTAEVELKEKETEQCGRMVPGDTHRNLHVATRLSRWSYDLALLPLWIAAYRYKDDVYRFLVNGQTGKVEGKAPISWVKLIVVLLIAAGAIGLGVGLWAIFGGK